MQKILSRRLAATGAATALAAGALVGATSVSAQAVALDTSYTCQTSDGPIPFAVRVDSPFLPTEAPAGLAAPALPLVMTVTVSDPLVDLLRGLGVTEVSASSSDMAVTVDKASGVTAATVPLVNIVMPSTPVPADGPMQLDTRNLDGSEGTDLAASTPFETPRSGSYEVNLPQSFTFTATDQNDHNFVDGATCTLTNGAENTLTPVTLTKNASTTTATVKNAPVNVGERARLGVTVAASNETPGGKVVVKKGKKTVGTGSLNDAGKDTIKLDRLPRGTHDLVVKYKGDGYTKKSNVPLTLKVRR